MSSLSELIEGLPTLWPEALSDGEGLAAADSTPIPKIDQMHAAHRTLALHVCLATRMYQLAAEEARPVMRQRRDDDPTTIETGASGGSAAYPRAINSDRITVGIIGCGQVGRMVVNSLLAGGSVRPEDIVVSTRQPGQLSEMTSLRGAWYKVAAGYNNPACAAHADVLIVAVPLSAISTVAKEVAASVRPTTLVVAVVSGVLTPKIRQLFSTDAVTRVHLHGQLVAERAPRGDQLVSEVGPDVAQDILRLSLEQDGQAIDELLLGVTHAIQGHSFGAAAATDCNTMGGSKEEQAQAGFEACQELVQRQFQGVDLMLASLCSEGAFQDGGLSRGEDEPTSPGASVPTDGVWSPGATQEQAERPY